MPARQEGVVWVPLELTRERKLAKAFIVISMGVCTLIKKKKERKNHVFYRQSDFIWEEQKIAIRGEHTVKTEAHASPENRRGLERETGGGCGVRHWRWAACVAWSKGNLAS